MGCCCSSPEVQRPEDIYASLVIPKPPPVEVAEIKASSSDDIPLFAPVASDDDQIEISDTGIAQIDDNEEEDNKENDQKEEEEEDSQKIQEKENPSDPDAVHFDTVKDSTDEEKESEKEE